MNYFDGWLAPDPLSPAQHVQLDIAAEMHAAAMRCEVNLERLAHGSPMVLANGDYLYDDGTLLSEHGPNGPAKPVLWVGISAES